MPSTELDLPVLVTPEQIRRREFVTTRRGYDVEQVRDYLEQLAVQVEQIESMLRTAKLEASAAERLQPGQRADPYEQLSQRFAEVLRTTDREADRVRREARDEAERILREARADADRIRLDAQSRAERSREEAERALREARNRADRTIAGLATRRDALVEQLAAMQGRLLGVAEELEAAIGRPDDDDELLASLQGAADDAGATIETPSASSDPTRPADAGDASTAVVDLGGGEAAAEELWSSIDPDELRPPEIPPLDLDWDDDDTQT
jgi:DivIVA domain-containing protein